MVLTIFDNNENQYKIAQDTRHVSIALVPIIAASFLKVRRFLVAAYRFFLAYRGRHHIHRPV
jgi:hypothetical protein